MAKAPVPGRCKTRLGADIGMVAAAQVAAAALLDTLGACTDAFGAERCVLALDGVLAEAVDGAALAAALDGWTVRPQVGADFASRIAWAHAEAGPGPVLQVGMDTPQAGAELLRDVAARLLTNDAVLGPAEDGGWWVLGLRDPAAARVLVGVPMSTAQTGRLTRAALEGLGLAVGGAPTLRDVDTVHDAAAAAAEAPAGAFARTWAAVTGGTRA
jgi:glycosyltransferase A (GT-A) superfamily protein (DUF2064 family)